MNAIFKPSNIHHISALVVMGGAISEDLFVQNQLELCFTVSSLYLFFDMTSTEVLNEPLVAGELLPFFLR